jgi:hypothetical protein
MMERLDARRGRSSGGELYEMGRTTTSAAGSELTDQCHEPVRPDFVRIEVFRALSSEDCDKYPLVVVGV